MLGALGVRLKDAENDRIVTGYATGVRFRKTAPGGHHSASCTLSLPYNTFPSLGPADRLYIYDARTGVTLWEGYTENPTPVDGPAGQAWEVSALGGMVLAQDMVSAVVFVDRSVDDYREHIDGATIPGGIHEVVSGPPVGLKVGFPNPTPVSLNRNAESLHQGLWRTGQTVASIGCLVAAPVDDLSNQWQVQVVTRDHNSGAGELDVSAFKRVTQTSMFCWHSGYTGTDLPAGSRSLFPQGRNAVGFRYIWASAGAGTTGTDTEYATFWSISVRAQLKNANGTNDLAWDHQTLVTVAEVVNHVVGALLPGVDGATASIAAGAFGATTIPHLTYESATPATILDDMTLYNPNGLWEILESTAAGKHRFVYRDWPTVARYEVSVEDGYTAQGGDVDLCNRILVNQPDAEGKTVTTVVTSTVAALGTRVRDADPITIPLGSSAATIGAAVLATKAGGLPRPATVVVRRPIADFLTGKSAMPWEIEPGYLVVVRETGETLRCTEVEYNDDSGSATLTLGNPVLSVEQRVVALTAR